MMAWNYKLWRTIWPISDGAWPMKRCHSVELHLMMNAGGKCRVEGRDVQSGSGFAAGHAIHHRIICLSAMGKLMLVYLKLHSFLFNYFNFFVITL
jgi:hypothetical protein